MSGFVSKTLFLLFTNWLLVRCYPVSQTATVPSVTPTPTFTPVPTLSPTLDATFSTSDTGWDSLQPGLERRSINIYSNQNQLTESLYIVRLDQNLFQLDVAYSETPKSLKDWQTETKASVVVNGGYFRIENDRYIPNGLTIVDGRSIGNSYDTYAGMLAINELDAELRWLADKPYDPNENLSAALQSFPVLIKPVGKMGFPEQYEDGVQARRTVIGQDLDGRILFIVASQGYFTLHQFSVYLTESDLNLSIAVNLDGGPSSGILVTNPPEIIPAQTPLPFVIVAYARQQG
jgi:hypothetical protein